MKRIRELLKEKKWRWTAGGVACLLTAALSLSLLSDMGVRADTISLGRETVDLQPVGSESGVYWVETADQLRKLGNATEGTAGLTFRLKNDIIFERITAPATGTFEGTFDGSGHVVTYEDIQITVTDETPSNASVSNGLLFGNVSGTVQNLIVEITDEDAGYTRKTKNPVKETIATPVFESSMHPIIGSGETVSGLSQDPAVIEKIKEIMALEIDSVTGNKVHTLQEIGTTTTTYAAEAPAEDYFGLICGKVSGRVQEVYLTGNAVSITREELISLDYSQSVQSGYREEKYYYSQEVDSKTEAAVSSDVSIAGTVYVKDRTYTEKIENDELSMTVWAAKAAVKGDSITYKVHINNESEETYKGVTVTASESGTWSDQFPLEIAAGTSVEVEFYYESKNAAANELSLDFTVTGTSGNAASAAKVSEVKTQLFESAGEENHQSVQGLELRILAPQVVEAEKAVVYQVTVTNKGDKTYSNVELQATQSGTWSVEGAFSLAANGHKNLTFTYDGANVTGDEIVMGFEAAAENTGTSEMVKAVVSEVRTQVQVVTTVSKTVSLDGLRVVIESPNAKKTHQYNTGVNYKITVYNDSDEIYEKVTLTSSKEGRWRNGNYNPSASNTYDLTQIPAHGSKSINFVYNYTTEDVTAGEIALQFTATKETEEENVTLHCDNSNVKLFTTETTFEKESSQGLELSVLVPQAEEKGENITYEATVYNHGSDEYKGVAVTASAGEWSETKTVDIKAGQNQEVTFTLPTTADSADEITADFTAAVTDTVTVKIEDAKTKLFSTAGNTLENGADGLNLSVLAPDKKGTGEDKTIRYELQLTNTGAKEFTDVTLTSTKTGRWNSTTNADTFTLAKLTAETPQTIVFEYDYSEEDENNGKISLDFGVSGSTDAATATVRVTGVETTLLDVSGVSEPMSLQGLQLYVTAPKEAAQNNTLEYRVKVINKGNAEIPNVKLSASKDGEWNQTPEFSIGPDKEASFTFTYTAGKETEAVIDFTASGENAGTSEKVIAKVTGVTTKLFDAEAESKVQTIPGLEATVLSAQAQVQGEETKLVYEITVTNTSNTEYTDVLVHTTKEGSWNGAEELKDSYEIGTLAAQESQTLTLECDYETAEAQAGETALDCVVTGKTAWTQAELNFENMITKLLAVTADSKTVESANGLKATLKVENNQILKGDDFEYTLTLENTNVLSERFILVKDLKILTDFSAGGWMLESTTAPDFALENDCQILPVGTKAVLKKTVEGTVAGAGLSNVQTESLTLKSELIKQAYKYTYDQTNSIPESVEFHADETAPVTSGSAIVSGNALYAGGITGEGTGTISKVKQSVNLSTGEINSKLVVGGIGGKTETPDRWSDIYMLSTINGFSRYDGLGNVLPVNSAKTAEEAKIAASASGNWASYTKYVAEGEAFAAQNFGDLAWLVKTEADAEKYFSYDAPVNGSLAVKIAEEKRFTEKTLDYTLVYNARRSMNDTTEDAVYVSTDGMLELAQSGFYRLLSAYASDGYYHYNVPTVELGKAAWVYPYSEETAQNPYIIQEQQVVRSSTNPLEDRVQLSFAGATEGKIYFDMTAAELIPNMGADSSTESVEIDNDGKALLPFMVDVVQYRVVPMIGGHIYPTQTTKEFLQSDKEPLPKPEILCYNYYNEDGTKKEYVAFGEGSYEAGTDMLIVPSEDETNGESYGFRYLYAVDAPQQGWNEDGRYIGTDLSFMAGALDYVDSAVIPESLEGEENVYLYAEVSKKNYASQVYCFGPFAVTKGDELKATLISNGEIITDYVALEGDQLTIAGAPENTSIQYMVATGPQSTYTWSDYPAEGFAMKQKQGGYVYSRIKYDETKYSKVFLFDYSFGGICADPRVTPNTGVSSDGDGAAATIGAATTVTLASRTPEAQIFYLVSDSSQSFTMERAAAIPSDVTEDGVISSDHYKYFKVGSRWYRTAYTETLRYSEGIQLSHQKKDPQLMYVSAVALAENYEMSATLEYVYKVQPVQQVSNPEAAYETRHMPGGENIEVSSVAKGAAISFFSVTPEAELYYAIGSGTEEPTLPVPGDGVVVEGNYGNNFVVRVQAKKEGMLPSEIITFVYVISDQEMVSAPTATPGTTDDVPTTVIPGNKILLSTATKEASIYYTTDGSSPKVEENEDEVFVAGNAETKLYDPNAGIVMPLDGSGYFSITAVAVKSGLAKSEETHFIYIYPGAVLKPYANIDSGKVELNAEIILKNLTEGAVIYYNVAYGDEIPGEPTLSSSVFSEEYPFTITQKTTIKAMAAKDGVKSEVATFVYEPKERLAAPEASIESGSVVARGTVLGLKAAEGATVYYTMDGSDPTDSANGAVMSGNTLTLNGEPGGQITIKAYAQASDKSQSEVVTFTYQFSQSAAGVTASIETGSSVSNGTKVNLMSDVTDAEIYYTTDGSSPIEHGKKGTIVEIKGTPGNSFTVKAVAVVNGEPGMMATFIYKIKERPAAPTASPSGGTLTIATRVSLSASTEKIYYTTDGTEPTESSALYTEPILVNRTTILKAIAVSDDGEMSEVATFVYTAAEKAATVVSDKKEGVTLQPGEEIHLTTNTEDAVIYYSTDGTEPTLDNLDHMLSYNGESIEIYRSVTISAVAYRSDLQLSDVAVWNYVVDIIPAVQQKKEDAAKKEEEGLRDTDPSALDRETDPSDDLHTRMLYENVNHTRVSYPQDAMPEQLELETIHEENSPLAVEKAKGIFGEDHTVLESYTFKVRKGTTMVQPKEKVEIAIPIPEGYEDAALTIAYVEEGHNLKTLETRREIGLLYAKTMELGKYVVIGPERENTLDKEFPYLLLLEGAAGITLFVGILFYVKEKIKKRRKKR